MAETIYTDAVLDENFGIIKDFMNVAVQKVAHLEGHVAELAKRPPMTIRVPKNSKLFLVALCATSVYVGYKLRDRAVQQKLQELKREFEERITAPPTPRVDNEN